MRGASWHVRQPGRDRLGRVASHDPPNDRWVKVRSRVAPRRHIDTVLRGLKSRCAATVLVPSSGLDGPGAVRYLA